MPNIPIFGSSLPANSTGLAGTIPVIDQFGNLNAPNGAAVVAGLLASGYLGAGFANYVGSSVISDEILVARLNAASGPATFTLPPVAVAKNQLLFCIKVDSSNNLATLQGNSSELIGANNIFSGLTAQECAVLLFDNGASWDILVRSQPAYPT